MKERPILFSSPMIRALLDGRKSQTRRVIKDFDPCLYGKPGDLLYTKEATWIWCKRVRNGTTKTGRPKYRYVPVGGHIVYCADGDKPTHRIADYPDHGWRYKAARFMPRRASRLTLRLTDVRVQRVQEISEEDAKAEGARAAFSYPGFNGVLSHPCYRWGFHELWDSINAARGFGWDVNPWVWCLSFSVINKNVDQVLKEVA